MSPAHVCFPRARLKLWKEYNKPILKNKGALTLLNCTQYLSLTSPWIDGVHANIAKWYRAETILKKTEALPLVGVDCGGPQKLDNVLSSALSHHPERSFS